MIINIKSRKVVVLLFCTIILLCVSFDANSQQHSQVKNQLQEKSPVEANLSDKKASAPSAPVMLGGEKLFFVRGVMTTTAEKRAQDISGRINKLAQDLTISTGSITTRDDDVFTSIIAGDQIIMALLDSDAHYEGRTRQELARELAEEIKTAVDTYRVNYSRKSIIFGAAYALAATLVLVLLFIFIARLFRRVYSRIEIKYRVKIHPISIKSVKILEEQQVWSFISFIIRLMRFVLILIIVYLYLHFVLISFPWTRPYAGKVFSYVLAPLGMIAEGIIKEIPNLLFIAVLIVITRLFLKFMHMFFGQIEQGTIKFQAFYQEWAKPTDRLLTILVIAFAAVVAFPYIPGSESPAFKGVSIFIGILFSLGSQSAIANFIAGIIVNYRMAFKIGDRVQVGDIIGDIMQIRLQVTHVKTIKNEEVVIPNTTIINSNIINYSSLARETGLILHTTVTIGYDAPWRQVHALLIMAAERTSDVLSDPPPFVLQRALNDFYVSYELNVYTDKPQSMIKVYSELHKNIQDCFNEYGVQIMSPNYIADRSVPTIVPKDKWYSPPAKPPEEKE